MTSRFSAKQRKILGEYGEKKDGVLYSVTFVWYNKRN